MDKFPGFSNKDEESTKLDIAPQQLQGIVSKLLAELNLELSSIQTSEKSDDFTAVAKNKLGAETKSIVRARAYLTGITDEDVEDLYEDMLEMKATSAIFITTSHFTKEAKEFVKHAPIQLVDGVELGKLLSDHFVPTAEFAFLSSFDDTDVITYFKTYRAKKFAGVLGTEERIEGIDRRYVPLGHFVIRKVSRDAEKTRNLFVDLNGGNILYMEEERIEEDGFFKKILDLPEESQTHLLDLIKYGELRHQHLDGKSLNILEKEQLVSIQDKSKGTGLIDILLDEVTSTGELVAQEVSSGTHSDPKNLEMKGDTKKYVREIMSRPLIDNSYDLSRFIEAADGTDPQFEPDPVIYDAKKIENILKTIYAEEDVSFAGMAYLPYYRCTYVSHYGSTRFKKLFTPRFKGFVPKHSPFNWLYRIIDVVPAVPYLIIAAAFILLNLSRLPYALHVLAVAFVFVTVAVTVGILMKVIFRTERKMPRYGNSIAKYGFPSIHALTAAGAVAFAYFVDPILSLALVPLAFLYVYSRLRLGVHNEADVFGGIIVGGALGLLFGIYVLNHVQFGETVDMILAALFFIVSIIVTLLESQYR
jgi:membrane-associated phospholipid phosphatase